MCEKSRNTCGQFKNRNQVCEKKQETHAQDFGLCIKIAIFRKKNTKTGDLDALEVTVFVK